MKSIARTLTPGVNPAILNTVTATAVAGIETPRKGHKRPPLNVVFFVPTENTALSCYGGCSIGQPLKRLAGSFAGSLNPIQCPPPSD